jgi:hypothetical protein
MNLIFLLAVLVFASLRGTLGEADAVSEKCDPSSGDCGGGCTVTKTRTLKYVYYTPTTVYMETTLTVTDTLQSTVTETSYVSSTEYYTASGTITTTITIYSTITAPGATTVVSTVTRTGEIAYYETTTTLTTNPVSTLLLETSSAHGIKLNGILATVLLLLGGALFFVI